MEKDERIEYLKSNREKRLKLLEYIIDDFDSNGPGFPEEWKNEIEDSNTFVNLDYLYDELDIVVGHMCNPEYFGDRGTKEYLEDCIEGGLITQEEADELIERNFDSDY